MLSKQIRFILIILVFIIQWSSKHKSQFSRYTLEKYTVQYYIYVIKHKDMKQDLKTVILRLNACRRVLTELICFRFFQLVIQSENSEDATNSEELTLTQQKYIPVFGKPTRSTLKSQQDGNVEKSVKRPRIENSQLAEDLKLEHVINKEEVWGSRCFVLFVYISSRISG